MNKLKEISLKKEWYTCPVCNTKLFIVEENAKARGLYIKCRTCKNEIKVEI